MAQPEKAIYRPRNGLAAIEHSAIGLEFLLAAPPQIPAPEGVACVNVCGPLAFGGFLFATYNGIREQVRAALASDAHTVLLVFDSPGGDVDGCFDCARGLRDDAAAAGKRLIGWVPSKVCSAAYALSTACERLYVASSAQVGSIGVIRELQSVVKADAAAGVEYAYVVSGAKKALGSPHMPLTELTLTEAQAHVDATAELFFALVKETRGFNPEALEAAVCVGEEAVRRKLADEVTTLDALLAQLTQPGERTEARDAGAIQAGSATRAESAMAKASDDKKDDKKDDMRASLQKAADGGDAKALRALKAYDEDGDDDKAKAKASDDDKKDDDGDKDKAKAEFPKKDDDKALAASIQAEALRDAGAVYESRLKALETQLRDRDAKAAQDAKDAFMATCAHLPEAFRKNLAALSLDQAKALVATLPPSFQPQAIAPEVGATRGASQAAGTEAARAGFMASPLAARMGAVKTEQVVEIDPVGHVQNFGVRKVKA